ncbi:hypothetical protein JANAI62_11560 [Jannaschia pagri]|uniref:Uncharacterized protein n=1 Tax=Jannaschia pagri TaxID=2829797 RepID=A0ABQ4NJD6_9RHOB|nr:MULTISPECIES: hypothetical protein [unclassified Jannaschia]GIT90701.1 hypothetical protein JANAI61_11590 [Jannaschia sp. AI_61]GIT94533.1 hypothetical protein JANAI62_11560 [Jannaschia sp. AI_62]
MAAPTDPLTRIEAAFGLPDHSGDRDGRLAYVGLLAEMLTAVQSSGLVPRQVHPAQRLDTLAKGRRTEDWLLDLSRASDLLLLPPLEPAAWVAPARCTGAALITAGAVAATWTTGEPGGLLLALAAPWVTLVKVPRRLPPEVQTLADLLRICLPENIPRLRLDTEPPDAATLAAALSRAPLTHSTPRPSHRTLEAQPWPI